MPKFWANSSAMDLVVSELYWEGIRRTDLVRFDLLTSGSYTWDFKGGINTGVGVNKRYNVYPIPVTDLTVNGNLQQNEGY